MIVDELSEDINLLINAINNGKNGIVHPQLLTPDILILEMKEFEEKLNVKYTIPAGCLAMIYSQKIHLDFQLCFRLRFSSWKCIFSNTISLSC